MMNGQIANIGNGSDRFHDDEFHYIENSQIGPHLLHFGIDRSDNTIVFYPTIPKPANSIRMTAGEASAFAATLFSLARKARFPR